MEDQRDRGEHGGGSDSIILFKKGWASRIGRVAQFRVAIFSVAKLSHFAKYSKRLDKDDASWGRHRMWKILASFDTLPQWYCLELIHYEAFSDAPFLPDVPRNQTAETLIRSSDSGPTHRKKLYRTNNQAQM